MNLSEAYERLSRTVTGAVLLPGDPDYEAGRRIWNNRLSGHPSLVIRCKDAEDVATSVKYFAGEGVVFSVKGGGHSFAGNGIETGIPLIDLSLMKRIEVDAEGRRGWIQPGVTWEEAYERGMDHGLTFTGGTVSSVGVSGYTLGGGTGYLARPYGLAIDNLHSVEVVTALGDIITASELENPDLFWALRGGSGNFGIVTSFEFGMHPVTQHLFAGQVMYPYERAREAMQAYRDTMENAPDGFTCYACGLTVPPIDVFPAEQQGETAICFVFAHIGDQQVGRSASERLRRVGDAFLDTSGPQPYLGVQRAFDAGCPYGQRWYSRSNFLRNLADHEIGIFIDGIKRIPGEFSLAYIEPLGGAISKVDVTATAFPHRNAPYSFNILAGWSDSDADNTVMSWARAFQKSMDSKSGNGVYVNLLSEDERSRHASAYGSNLQRLRDLKRKWDPFNIFSRSYSIPLK